MTSESSREHVPDTELLTLQTPRISDDGGILFILAHPDDETFICGGTIARYANSGVSVHCVCGTRGESGTVNPELRKDASIADIRSAELACAARQLGLSSVYFLGYRDSGMAGSSNANDPHSLFQAPLGEVTEKLVAIIRDVRPRIVVTHGQYGEYGHPDHIRLHEATRLAVDLAGDESQPSAWSANALYVITINPLSIRMTVRWLRLLRRDPRLFGRNGDVDLMAIVENAQPATCAIDTRAWLSIRDRATACHTSQLGGRRLLNVIPRRLRRRFEGSELYIRLHPPVSPDEPVGHDLLSVV